MGQNATDSSASRAPFAGSSTARREPGRSVSARDHDDSGLLRPKNLTTQSGRTSVRLEADLWDAYDEICRTHGLSRNRLATLIEGGRASGLPFTAAIRVFLIGYFRHRFAEPTGTPDHALDHALSTIAPHGETAESAG